MQLGGVHSTRQLSRHEPVPSWGFTGPAECNRSWEETPGRALGNSGPGKEVVWLLLEAGRWEGGTQLVPLLSQAHTRSVLRSKHPADSSNAPALGALGGQGGHVEDGLRHVPGANWDTGGAVRPVVPP